MYIILVVDDEELDFLHITHLLNKSPNNEFYVKHINSFDNAIHHISDENYDESDAMVLQKIIQKQTIQNDVELQLTLKRVNELWSAMKKYN